VSARTCEKSQQSKLPGGRSTLWATHCGTTAQQLSWIVRESERYQKWASQVQLAQTLENGWIPCTALAGSEQRQSESKEMIVYNTCDFVIRHRDDKILRPRR
jgi:hypothetical protein